MLKGDVFKNQIFENHIFALFINLFMNKSDGVARDYKNAMEITYSGHNVTINSGACLIQGRLLEEDSSTTVDAGIETMFCKLVVEIDLDKQNSSVFNQGYYNIVKSSSNYPDLTQQDIAGQNSGKYQFELARFKISDGIITDFEDKRMYIEEQLPYLDLEKINKGAKVAFSTAGATTYNDGDTAGIVQNKSIKINLSYFMANNSEFKLTSDGGVICPYAGDVLITAGVLFNPKKGYCAIQVFKNNERVAYNSEVLYEVSSGPIELANRSIKVKEGDVIHLYFVIENKDAHSRDDYSVPVVTDERTRLTLMYAKVGS